MLFKIIAISLCLWFQYLNAQTDSTNLKEIELNEIIIEDQKSFSRDIQKTEILHILDQRKIQQVTACNIAEGLNFQSGLRVETNCQTCNYTQLRMNGLQGNYTQILFNGVPIMSAFMSLYGLEQFSSKWIERIEIQKGSGSSVFGSSAIGGSVNIITQMPKKSFTDFEILYQNIDFQSSDWNISSNNALVNKNQKIGLGLVMNYRKRQFYDANNDQFSELPYIQSMNLGTSFFYKPSHKHNLQTQILHLNEYRLGGDMKKIPINLLEQVEERNHKIFIGDALYRYSINGNLELNGFSGFQFVKKKSLTGVMPDNTIDALYYQENLPYGTAFNNTFQAGTILKYTNENLLSGENLFQVGAEYISEQINDKIPSYNYEIQQTTHLWGAFIQNEWKKNTLKLKKGIRLDKHNAISKIQVNPRLAILYQIHDYCQLRFQTGSGFRPPVFLDTDLHIAFAGGGVSRIFLAPNILPEKAHSYTVSINFDKPAKSYIYGFTLDAFYTRLKNIFALENIGSDNFGQVFEKRNQNLAIIQGLTIEFRANYKRKLQVETGITFQKQNYQNEVFYFEDLEGQKIFLRTPNVYGFALFYFEWKRFAFNLNYNYTGKMLVPHFGGAENFPNNAYVQSPDFHVLGLKINYEIFNQKHKLSVFGGTKNFTNAYQKDFDIGKNRDSNYIYGPNLPRTFFVGINWSY